MNQRNLLTARTVDYLELIGVGKSYTVPPYQRDYSWTEEEWADLWNDIVGIRERPEQQHYLGAVVVQAHGERKFLVIDGQQRFATLSLLSLAVIRRLRELAQQGTDVESNQQRAKALHERFIGERDPASLIEQSRLELNATDDEFYRDVVVQGRTPSNPPRLPRSKRLIWDAFCYFSDRLREHDSLGDDGAAVAELLSKTVSNQLLFILITVENELNAYTVFETLNARGVELTTTDLLKNYLFSHISVTSDQEDVHRRWRALRDTVRSEKFPDFLRYHLLSEHSKIRRPHLFKLVREKFHTLDHVFALFKALENRAELFAALADPAHEYWKALPKAKPLVRELVLFRVRQMTPVLFAAWERFSRHDFVRVLKMISVISFRYNIVSRLSRSELEPAYARAAIAIGSGTANSPAQVFELLRTIYVEDDRMRSDFAGLELNTHGQRRKVVRYILARLEEDASKRHVDFETDPATIEHILPENAGEAWENEFEPAQQGAFLYRIGNLTLLEGAINRQIGNSSYSRKVAAYEGSKYEISRQVAEMAPQDWTPALVDHRQKRLADRAAQIWRADFA